MSKIAFVCSIVLVLLLSLGEAPAQRTTAEVLGTVTDETGGVIPGVDILITSMDTGATRSDVTDGSGNYHVQLLQVGRYSVSGG